jgi:hypothetical protein
MIVWLLGTLLYGVLLTGALLLAAGVRRGDERFAQVIGAVGEPAAAPPQAHAGQNRMGTDS